MIIFDKNTNAFDIFSIELNNLKVVNEFQNNLRNNVLAFMEQIASAINELVDVDPSTNIFNFLKSARKSLEASNVNLGLLNNLSSIAEEYKNSNNDLLKLINDYNDSYINTFRVINKNNVFITDFIDVMMNFSKIEFPASVKVSTINTDINTPVSSSNKNDLENILIVSEVENKAFLPYTFEDLNAELNNSPHLYSSIDDVIEKKYTVSLDLYKNSSVARFREAFRLVKKSNGSLKDAFDLSLELFFKYDLNPVIITACRNLDELDVYLSCLDDNELDKFFCFEIIYNIAPTVVKKKKDLW